MEYAFIFAGTQPFQKIVHIDVMKSAHIQKERRIKIILFFSLFFIFLNTPFTTVSDSKFTIPLAVSVLKEGNINLDEFGSEIREHVSRGSIVKIDDHFYYYFPIGTAILSIPFVAVLSQFHGTRTLLKNHAETQKLIASLWMAFCALLMYQMFRKQGRRSTALLISITFALGSSVFSICSEALWQQSGAVLINTWILYLLFDNTIKYRLWLLGLALGISFIVRPLGIIVITAASLYLIIENGRNYIYVFIPGILIALLFVIMNLSIYGEIIPPYFNPSRVGNLETFGEALAANLISPGRGFFLWSPVFIFSFIGLVKGLKQQHKWLYILSIFVIVIHWIVDSSFKVWWAGDTLGPRFFCDILPFFSILLFPLLSSKTFKTLRPLRYSFFILLAFSIIVHYRASSHLAIRLWNISPVTIDKDPGRFWDWKDIPYLRGDKTIKLLY